MGGGACVVLVQWPGVWFHMSLRLSAVVQRWCSLEHTCECVLVPSSCTTACFPGLASTTTLSHLRPDPALLQARGETDSARSGSAKLQADLAAAQASLRAAQQEAAQAKADLAASSQQAASANSRVEALTSQLAASKAGDAELRQQLESARVQVRELQGEKAAAAGRAAAAESSLQEVTRVEGELRRQVGPPRLCWYEAAMVLWW